MYQTHRQILWGFTSSLISSDLLVQYTWSGRRSHNNKLCFESMKQVQGVLWCAMVKIAPEYSVQSFEEDMKAVLAKCLRGKVSNMDKESAVIDGNGENDSMPMNNY